jgi:hypothetical protein
LALRPCILETARDASVPRVIAYGATLLLALRARGERKRGSFGRALALRDVICAMPFVALMIFAVIVLCMFRGTATTLADAVMGR